MLLNRDSILKVLSNLGVGNIVNTILGDGISMNSYDAFIYSYITGARYFIHPTFGYTPKGRFLLFEQALSDRVVSGMFDRGVYKNSPLIHFLNLNNRDIFSRDRKIIIPLEFEDPKQLSALKVYLYNELISKNCNPNNFIIHEIPKLVKGYSLEPFMEYVACVFMKNQGYLVDSQIQLYPTIGSPDTAFFKLSHLNLNNGLFFIEIALSFLKPTNLLLLKNSKEPSSIKIVGEAKTSTTMMVDQIKKYMSTGLFDAAIEIHPTKISQSLREYGLINIDNNFNVRYIPPVISNTTSKINEDYQSWLENIIGIYAISNLQNDAILDIFENAGILNPDLRIENFITYMKLTGIGMIIDTVYNHIK